MPSPCVQIQSVKKERLGVTLAPFIFLVQYTLEAKESHYCSLIAGSLLIFILSLSLQSLRQAVIADKHSIAPLSIKFNSLKGSDLDSVAPQAPYEDIQSLVI